MSTAGGNNADDGELDPQIQIELENLNNATDEINKLEIELEEANSTFRILLNESTRRLKLSTKKLGSSIEKARPYHEALQKAREAQVECQKAADKFKRAHEIHLAAKETFALAEKRFMSNSHEWQFDNAWQEMLNHATERVVEAGKQKDECHAAHLRLTQIFNEAERKMQQQEARYRRSIIKSRPYFEEKQICQDQLQTQKQRIQELQQQVANAKAAYASALRSLERISNDIHRQRGDYAAAATTPPPPPGPREPGVGAELNTPTTPTLPDFELELAKCDEYALSSLASSQLSLGTNSSEPTTMTTSTNESVTAATAAADKEDDLELLMQKMKKLAVRPIECGDKQQVDVWESELNATVNKLDQLMLLRERAKLNLRPDSLGAEAAHVHTDTLPTPSIAITPAPVLEPSDANGISLPVTPVKTLTKLTPPSSVNVSMRELPLLARISHELKDRSHAMLDGISRNLQQRRRSLD